MDLKSSISPEKIEIFLDSIQTRPNSIYVNNQGNFLQLPIYTADDRQVSGKVKLNLKKKVKHLGVFIQLIGEARTYHSLDKPKMFLYHSYEAEIPGTLKGERTYEFSFNKTDAKCETYYGLGGNIRYYIRALIAKKAGLSISNECEFAVQMPISDIVLNQGFDIQLRIADYLMISVELNRLSFHIDECLMGKITIEQVKLAIKRIQVSIIKREIINPTETIACTKENIVTRLELSDKCPKKGDLIPFKIYLGGLSLSPTLSLVNPKILVKYIMVISFVDEDDRSLFKPIEINTWRKK